ncbi:amino acid adenylation domain-containing protein [Micromonospora matsumotoense]|uniref:Amino acid adenylation domain-containing protein n=1 Tax=Micromonospora matsumotoense TaxID=121616 RepID=A0A1C5AR89_9ACTN|nr:AMP-binding protein [Micromonospora matsumotoense]SCF47656.1 amino acid adenylation domain-containing protein [Micromonospora matsumotoense]
MELPDLLTDLFRRHRDRTALRTAGRSWTYQELDRVTGALAARIGRECPPGRRVLVAGEHTIEATVWALAVMRSHGVYTPMNPGLPADRFVEFARVAEAGLLVCFDRAALLRAERAGIAALHAGDVGWPAEAAPAGETTRSRVAYSIFTSGSTGNPKLVDVGHGGLLNLCRSLRRRLDITPDDDVLQFGSLSFDASITEILGALYAGATLVVPAQDGVSWLGSVSRHLAAHGADLAMIPPSVYARLDAAARGRIRKVQFCGEALGENEYREAARHGRVFNAYGPTEATVCFSLAELTEFENTIGTPNDGFRAVVRDPETGAYATAGTGELIIVGDGVALGYAGATGTENDVFRTYEGSPAYATGDVVTLAPDGRLAYVGRNDEQIKRLGHRVNLAHVESLLARHLGRDVALIRRDETILLVTTGEGADTPESLMARIRGLVPVWEAPDHVVLTGELPLTPGGKVDRNALRDRLDTPAPAEDDADAAVLAQVLGVVTAVLGREIDPETSIFDAGGSSLAMIQIQVKLSEAHGEHAVEAAFAAMDYDFVPATFVRHLGGGTVAAAASPAETLLHRVERDRDALRAELPTLRRDTRHDPDPAIGDRAVLLTGASGFIGGHVLDRLLTAGRGVLVVATGDPERVLTGHRARFGRAAADYARVRAITYAELEQWIDRRRGPALDAVLHCGYQVNHLLPLDSHLTGSVRNTTLVVRGAAALGARSFAFLSAASAGREFGPLSAAALTAAGDPYSRSKLIAEEHVNTLAGLGCAVAHYRPGLVYGHRPEDHDHLKDDWFTALIGTARRVGVMPRITGHVPVCDVGTLAGTLLAGIGPGPDARSAVVVHRTYPLGELLAHAGLTAADVVEPAEWFERVRAGGEVSPPLLAAMQAALSGPGWPTAHREVEHDILGRLLGSVHASSRR